MTETHLLRESFVSEEEQRFLQALPFIFSFALTVYMPIAARKSLSAWRALQVYDSQEPPKKGFTGQRKRKVWEIIMASFYCFSPSVLQLIAFIPIKNEASWPIFSAIRRCSPFAVVAIILSLSSFKIFGPLLLPVQRVERALEPIADKETKEKKMKATFVSITRNTTKPSQTFALFIILFSFFVPIFVACYFANSSGSILIVVVMAIASTTLTMPALMTPMAVQPTVSLRSHVKFIVLGLMAAIALFLAVFAIAFCGTYLYLTYVSSDSFSNSKGSEKDINVDMVMSQTACLLYTAVWPVFMAYPAFLMNLAYRFDVSKAGLTQVTDEQKKEAILESREVAKHCKASKHPDHHYDDVGRTPILMDAIALRLPQKIKESDLPTFTATMKTMIVTQSVTLFIIWGFLPSWFNIPFFVRSQEGAEVFPFPITLNFGILLSFFTIIPVMLFSAGYHAKKNGQTFGSGVRAIWTYEEKWGADYFQTKIDHQMDTEDEPKDEKDEKLLVDITKEDLEEKGDLNA
ncbi:uncharacterized protein FA14DRAFT_32208 [Meira miltonrushii]|uniref:Uncharacterized protein n=1 Tax=Meira miltonrushii TaxID=1280837 RepID=A0A316VAJ6_9BASI|nr:uncharacterized protein FA14DRAFT_32208 [Meira miltonrushii]PWN34617.1 hypothetical protein FA14DRAFT_32208 [Meira miltonrushii]